MFVLKDFITGLSKDTNRKVNKDIYIKNGVVYITYCGCHFKYQGVSYFMQQPNGDWIEIAGGKPDCKYDTNPDEDLFIEEINEQGE